MAKTRWNMAILCTGFSVGSRNVTVAALPDKTAVWANRTNRWTTLNTPLLLPTHTVWRVPSTDAANPTDVN